MLDELKKAGLELCIISDAAYTDVLKWKESPLSKYFTKTIFSCEEGCSKPSYKLYEKAKNVMGNPQKCVFIGDGGHDELQGAHNANMITIKVEWFINRNDEKINREADYCVKRIDELKEVLEKIREF